MPHGSAAEVLHLSIDVIVFCTDSAVSNWIELRSGRAAALYQGRPPSGEHIGNKDSKDYQDDALGSLPSSARGGGTPSPAEEDDPGACRSVRAYPLAARCAFHVHVAAHFVKTSNLGTWHASSSGVPHEVGVGHGMTPPKWTRNARVSLSQVRDLPLIWTAPFLAVSFLDCHGVEVGFSRSRPQAQVLDVKSYILGNMTTTPYSPPRLWLRPPEPGQQPRPPQVVC